MTIAKLKKLLEDNPDKLIRFILPNDAEIPAHFHITEVGHVRKDFIDCGGTQRSSSACLLQAWVAHDKEHRLNAGKLASILKLAAKILPSEDLSVEVEFEAFLISQFPVASAETTPDAVVFHLTTKHTDCLAKESCGLDDGLCGSGEDDCCGSEEPAHAKSAGDSCCGGGSKSSCC